MRSSRPVTLVVPVMILGWAFLLFAPAAEADTILYWTTPGGGAWDNMSLSWATAANGSGTVSWEDGDVADFCADNSPGSATIIISTGVSANGVTFDAGGYTVTGGQLTLVGGGFITANYDATITSVIGGSVGLTLGGGGAVQLDGNNTFTGATLVQNGTLSGTGTLTGGLTIAAGAHLAPGDNAAGYGNFNGVGTLTVGSLTLSNNRSWIST